MGTGNNKLDKKRDKSIVSVFLSFDLKIMKPKEENDLIHCQSCNEPQNYDFEFIFWDLSSSRVNYIQEKNYTSQLFFCLTAKSENHVTSAVLNEKVSPCCSSAKMSPSTLFRRRFFQTFVRNKNCPSTLFKWFCTLRKFLISKNLYLERNWLCSNTKRGNPDNLL